MEYSIWLDVCSIFILLSLFLAYKLKKAISIYRNNLLIYTILCMLLNSFIDLLVLGLNGITKPPVLYILHSLKYILMYTSLCLMLVYASIAVNRRIHGRNILKLFITPIIFIMSLLIVNYKTGLIFTVTAGGHFEYGPCFATFYLLDIYYIAVVSFILIRGRKALSRNHKVILPAIVVILLSGTVYDYFVPHAASLQFTSTIFITMVF